MLTASWEGWVHVSVPDARRERHNEKDEDDDDAELDLRVPAASGVCSASGSPRDSERRIGGAGRGG